MSNAGGKLFTYDPAARRDTPLARELKARIRDDGPISVEAFMEACLCDPEHGYYCGAEVLGRGGDFVTAPEISQVFGELIGLWCVATWQAWGEPSRFNLVELGAGRGTMMADALRAARVAPKFLEATEVFIFEQNPTLKRTQQQTLSDAGVPVHWTGLDVAFDLEPELADAGEDIDGDGATIGQAFSEDDIAEGDVQSIDLPDAPTLLLANEFLDCLPVSQFVATEDETPGWQRRFVDLDEDGEFQFTLGRYTPSPDAPLPLPMRGLENAVTNAQPGDIFEVRDYANSDIGVLVDLMPWPRDKFHGALFIDYGHVRSSIGDTLQSVRGHGFEHPLTSPGEADVSAQVDFELFARVANDAGFEADGPLTQGEFLGRLGLVERASKLMSSNPEKAAQIEADVHRLMAPQGMGGRFKVIGVRGPETPQLPGF